MSNAIAKSKPDLLPVNYVSAKQALATCERVDECKDWADKALALKSYAKQMNDESLENMAQRIRDRAVRRGGELLEQVQGQPGQRTDQPRAPSDPRSRKAVAKDAGLSSRQAKQMLRVANVPEDVFESMVEADKPATVKQIAAVGTKKSERVNPAPFRNEWIDWTNAVRHLSEIPACSLAALAERRTDLVADLKADCALAIINLRAWQQALESAHVKA
jgi:hypothetical protein